MQLKSLLGPEVTARSASGATEIAGITADSRQVRPGWLFAAMPGSKADGARFVPEAIAKGAAAILVKEGTQVAAPAGDRRAHRRRAAPGAGHDGGALLPGPARHHRRRHRHQRQDLGRRLRAPDLRPPRPQGRLARHHRPRQARRQRLRRPHHARSRHAAPDAGRAGSRGRHAPRLRGLLARARSAPARRRPAEGCGLHQSRPRPSRLPPEHGGLSRRQAAPLHRAAAA